MNQEKIGKFIAECRKKQNLTQQELADKLGLTYKAISKWECGKGLPDVTLYEPLCNILKISLNEFFAGEHIKDKDINKQSERNILNILKSSNIKNKKNKLIVFILIILVLILITIVTRTILINNGIIMDSKLNYTQAYIINESNIKGNVDINYYSKKSIDFDIGANKYGYAVFKDPKKAMNRLKKDYSKGINLIRKEFNLLPLNTFNYSQYGIYGWQVTIGTDEEQEQASFVSEFMDIYENSFN